MWFDVSTVEAIRNAIPAWLGVVLLFVTFLGSVYVIVPGVVLAYVTGDRRRTATWPGTVIGGYGLFITLKPLFSITRPPVDPPFSPDLLPTLLSPLYDLGVGPSSASFPSGHAVAVTVFWGLVAVDLSIGSSWKRLAGCVLVISLVGFSRVALGVHYPGDIVGGIAIGGLYLGGMVLLRRRVSKPVTATVLIGTVCAAGGLLSGRTLDAATLITAAAVTALFSRHLGGDAGRAARFELRSD
ncbi:phosphatase PAP2 family protein [Natrialbaceae archaeon A-arb3/5]